MTDRATPNLPSRDFEITSAFYGELGFTSVYRSDDWMILHRGEVVLEFFLYADLNPATSGFSCCLRLDDLDTFYATCRDAGIRETTRGWPRLHPPATEDSGLRIGALIDPDCTLLRLIAND